MSFAFKRSYRGPLKCAILDWAGTTMDHGVYAPAVVDEINALLSAGNKP